MDLVNINTLLFAGKWALVGLVYLFLTLIIITVRREITSRSTGLDRAVAVAAGRLKVIKSGSDKKLLPGQILLLRLETRLGAGADNDLILKDQYISKNHARLHWDGAMWWVEDLGSTNGTIVDGQLCPPQSPQAIRSGASLQVGDMVFELMAQA